MLDMTPLLSKSIRFASWHPHAKTCVICRI